MNDRTSLIEILTEDLRQNPEKVLELKDVAKKILMPWTTNSDGSLTKDEQKSIKMKTIHVRVNIFDEVIAEASAGYPIWELRVCGKRVKSNVTNSVEAEENAKKSLDETLNNLGYHML